jgi:hypothetical protein
MRLTSYRNNNPRRVWRFAVAELVVGLVVLATAYAAVMIVGGL